MPAYILIRATDWPNAATHEMAYRRGYPVSVMDSNQYLGDQVMPNYVQLVISDRTAEQVQQYCREWMRMIDWEVVNSNLSIDGWRLRIFTVAEWLSAGGKGSITREAVENFINEWGGTVFSIAQNEVVFDATVYNALISEGLWGGNISNIAFNELSYDEGTGIHQLTADFSGTNLTAEKATVYVLENGFLVDSVDVGNKVVTFSASRSAVLARFKERVKEQVDNQFSRRIWKLDDAAVSLIEGAGGSLTVTAAQLVGYLIDRRTVE